jgi:hypothetical protein
MNFEAKGGKNLTRSEIRKSNALCAGLTCPKYARDGKNYTQKRSSAGRIKRHLFGTHSTYSEYAAGA